MDCEQTQTLLNDFVDGTLPLLQTKAVRQHCASCESCSRFLSVLQRQIAALQSLPVPQVSTGFEKFVVKHAIEDANEIVRQNNRLDKRVYKFAVAAVIVGLVLGISLINTRKVSDTMEHMVNVDSKIHTIKVAIDSEKALDGVSLRVELSDNLELAGFGNKRQINWTARLRKGVNVISLPIIGIAQGEGDITTSIRLNGKEKIVRIKTQFKLPDTGLYKTNEMLQS